MSEEDGAPKTVFESVTYDEWRRYRMGALARFLGDGWCRGKTVLELGGGDGKLTEMLLDGGAAHVTMVEGRENYCITAEERLRGRPAKVLLMDIETKMPDGHWDIVVHAGLLYHIGDPVASITRSIERCDLLVLETEVVDLLDDGFVAKDENPAKPDDGIGPIGVRLSPSAIVRAVSDNGMTAVDVPVTHPADFLHWYDWEPTGDGLVQVNGRYRRKMFVCQRTR